jgi:hypothetical protein
VVAFNNCAIEFEYLGQVNKAIETFFNAGYICEKMYGERDDRTLNLYKQWNDLKRKQQ